MIYYGDHCRQRDLNLDVILTHRQFAIGAHDAAFLVARISLEPAGRADRNPDLQS